jgi:hypothetical protein
MVTGALQMLDEMFGPEEEAAPTWSEQRPGAPAAIQDQQRKGARILRTVLEPVRGQGLLLRRGVPQQAQD